MIDICTKEFEMKTGQAKAICLADLIHHYRENHDRGIDTNYTSITTYDLAEVFIKDMMRKNPNSHFVFDKVPIMQKCGSKHRVDAALLI